MFSTLSIEFFTATQTDFGVYYRGGFWRGAAELQQPQALLANCVGSCCEMNLLAYLLYNPYFVDRIFKISLSSAARNHWSRFLLRSCQCESKTRYRSETISSPGAASVKPRLDDIEGKPLPPLLIGLAYRGKSAAEFAAVFHWRKSTCKQGR